MTTTDEMWPFLHNENLDSIKVPYRYAVLHIYKFSFNGPLTLDGEEHF